MKQTSAEYKSPLVQAIEARPRKTHLFRVNEFLGLPGPEVHHVEIRVATKEEEDRAVDAARSYVKALATNEEARTDPDLLLDAKSCHILHTVCREAGNADLGGAFLGPEWMVKHFTTDHIACLLNLYREVRKAEGPAPKELTDEVLESASALCVASEEADDVIPQMVLAAWTRETLSEAFVALSVKLDVARREAERAQSVAKELREQIAELTEKTKNAEPTALDSEATNGSES
jgi:hypothetical protein